MNEVSKYIKNLRIDFSNTALSEESLNASPFKQFECWMELAVASGISEPNAMNLATADADGRPSSRIVLLKEFAESGFVFFTNYASKKGWQMEDNNFAALNFFWEPLHLQVRIEGKVEKTSETESEEYFYSRPRESQLAALSSSQSEQLKSRAELDEKFRILTEQYKDKTIPRPVNWGGYRLKPFLFEFWQGRNNRLHDRFQYDLQPDNSWQVKRLYP